MCSPEKCAHCWYSTHKYACHALFGLHTHAMRNCVIQINLDRNHLWKWIGINLDQIRIGRMCIQCGHTQTEFHPVQCALSVQCGQAFIVFNLAVLSFCNLCTFNFITLVYHYSYLQNISECEKPLTVGMLVQAMKLIERSELEQEIRQLAGTVHHLQQHLHLGYIQVFRIFFTS